MSDLSAVRDLTHVCFYLGERQVLSMDRAEPTSVFARLDLLDKVWKILHQ